MHKDRTGEEINSQEGEEDKADIRKSKKLSMNQVIQIEI